MQMHPMIDGSTQLYGLIGSNILKSLSPLIHNTAFLHYGYNSVYIPLQVRTVNEAEPEVEIVNVCRMLGFGGLNVTMPYKEKLLKSLHHMDEHVLATGAVNTISFTDGKVHGFNTDVYGFIASLHHAGVNAAGSQCLIFGAGGAAKAVGYGLIKEGAGSVTFAARDPERALFSVVSLEQNSEGDARLSAADIGLLDTASMHNFDLIINATPVGMYGHPQLFTSGAWSFRNGQVFYDLVYHPIQTPLMKMAQESGCKVLGGLDMLIFQAIRSFQIWKGIVPEYALIRKAIMDRGV